MIRCLRRVALGHVHINRQGNEVPIPWSRHPAVMMWQNYEPQLCRYMELCELYRRQYQKTSVSHWEWTRMLMGDASPYGPGANDDCLGLWMDSRHDETFDEIYWWGHDIHDSHLAVLEAKASGMKHPQYRHLYHWPTDYVYE